MITPLGRNGKMRALLALSEPKLRLWERIAAWWRGGRTVASVQEVPRV